MLVKTEQSSHWYLKDGTPFYEVPNKSKPGEMRKANIKDARQVGAVPSVTTVLSVLAKPQLVAWKIEQAILAALTLPRLEAESEDDYARRVARDASSISREAASLGTDFHRYADIYDETGTIPADDGTVPMDPRIPHMMKTYARWKRKNIQSVPLIEECVVSPLGFGGRLDRIYIEIEGSRVVADFKTQATKQGNKVRSYPEHGMQLVAYAKAKREPDTTKLWCVIVSTTEMGRIEVVDWTDQRTDMWMMFNWAHQLWMKLNKYDPRKAVQDADSNEKENL